jgi:heme oxygenase
MSQAIAERAHGAERASAGLSAALRAGTRAAHAAAEKRFVRAAKAVPGSGPRLLMGLNLGLVSWLDRAAPMLPPGRLRDEPGVFTGAVLEAHADGAGAGPSPGPDLADPALSHPDEIAGAAYAICGSTLGASVLADAWRDETDARWVRFCAASRALERRWPLFAAALDDWGGTCDEPARRIVLSGADRAFAHAGALVDALSRIR